MAESDPKIAQARCPGPSYTDMLKADTRPAPDYLLIESTGISEPAPVADTFTFAMGDGVALSEIAELLSDRELRERLKVETDPLKLHEMISRWEPLRSVA